jgi:hypothetical protein
VNGREPKGVTQFRLGQGELETIPFGETDDLEAKEQLTQQVSGMLKGRAPPHRHDPVAVDGGIDGKVHGKQTSQMRVALGDLADELVGNQAGRAGPDRHDSMVHLLHEEAVQVNEVAGHMKSCDLALPIPEDVVARGQAGEENNTLGRAVTLPHHVLTLCDRFLPGDGLRKKPPFRV